MSSFFFIICRPAVIENNPEKEFIKANVELLVSLPNDPTTLFKWTQLHGELVTQEEILEVDLIEGKFR
jgi:hypothetical protein